MSLKIISLICLVILISGLGCNQRSDKTAITDSRSEKKLSPQKKYVDFAKETDTTYNVRTYKEIYLRDCWFENEHEIMFPTQKPSYAMVHLNDAKPGVVRLLTTGELNLMIKVINDTASYAWGEIGTPYFDKYITFHNKAGRCIAIMNVSYDYQIESRPSIAKMKDGHLNDKAMIAFKSVLEQK